MKRVLIIGAGFLQSFVIRKAKEMGYYTFAIDKNPNSIGFLYADEYGIIDIVDQDACLRFAYEKRIDGIMTAATDYGVLSTAYVAQQMKLPGLNYEVAKIIKNKYMVRRTLFENKIDDISQYYKIDDIKQLEKIKDSICFPVMIKPCDGSGSKAAKRVDIIDDLESACEEAIGTSLIGEALIEDFIEGKEYGVESFVYNGQVNILGIIGKHMTEPPNYAELGHFMPSQSDIEEKVREAVKNTIEVLGINFGAVNMDVLITEDNCVCIIDVGARMGGNLIGSHIISLGTGIDYMGNLIRAAVGDSVNLKQKNGKRNIATRLLALKPGKVIRLLNFNEIEQEYKVKIYHNLRIGDTIKEYHNNLDGCGYVVTVADTLEKAKMQAEEARRSIDASILRIEQNNNRLSGERLCI